MYAQSVVQALVSEAVSKANGGYGRLEGDHIIRTRGGMPRGALQ